MQIKGYPNPFQNNFNIDLGSYYEKIDITIYNTLGQQVFSENYTDSRNIQLEFNQSIVMYFLEVKMAEQNQSVLKVIMD